MAQFQAYARGLHDQAIDVHVVAAVPGQRLLVHTLLTQGRKLDTLNPRRAAMGSDFGRLGFGFIDDLKAAAPSAASELDALAGRIEMPETGAMQPRCEALTWAFSASPARRGGFRDSLLEELIDYRNAIGHGDEAAIASIEGNGRIRATKGSYKNYRQMIDRLAGTMDEVVANELSALLGVNRPW